MISNGAVLGRPKEQITPLPPARTGLSAQTGWKVIDPALASA
jgi:hypothetical protein